MIRVSSFLLLTLMKSGTRDVTPAEITVHLRVDELLRICNQFSFLCCSPSSWLCFSLLQLTRDAKLQVLTCHDSQRQPLLKQHKINTAVNFYTVFTNALYKVRQLLAHQCGAWGIKTGMGRRTCLRSHHRKQGHSIEERLSSRTRSCEREQISDTKTTSSWQL